ncbi:hypothetical protein [Streptantibioticus ferralitis]|uniref:Large membrane protein n=1 Tax=Streptantibioticus ferralitis TaxID=236510 RepID=A0ABT5Z892_9ACTN|nr:hypothetical protein [Streptantibioticus ferralitis]MDF2260047.1 hypothetical protein [Streptantibioticus ferralitis]
MGIERTPERKPESGSAGTSGVSEPTGGPRRRRSSLTVALVAGAVLVAGGGGAYWAASAAGGTPGPAAAGPRSGPAPLALSGWAAADGAAPGLQYRATGALPSGPGSAPVFQPRGEVSRDDVAKLAAALGVSGPVTLDHGLWRAAPSHNAPGPTLQVAQQAPGSWAFSRDGSGTGCRPSTANGGEVSATGRAICYSPERAMQSATAAASSGTAASPDQAKHAAAPVLTALGLDGARVDATHTAGGFRSVVVDPVVGGLATHGWQTTLQVGSDGGLSSGSGRLAALTQGASYPAVSAQRALNELNGSGTGPSTSPSTGPSTGPGADPSTGPCRTMHPGIPGSAPSGPADPGDLPLRVPSRCAVGKPQPLDVRGARFGLSAQFVNGRPELVPSWLFQVAQPVDQRTTEIAQPAVDPKYIVPPAGTSPASTPPGNGNTSSRVHIESYTTDGATLTLHFWGGVCSNYSATVVSQSADAVKVQITSAAKNPKQICVLIAKSISTQVTLDKPLGGRTVYDSSDGQAVPQTR